MALSEVKESRQLIDSVAKSTNPLFSILKTYGTNKFPYCVADDVAKLLEIKSADAMVKGFTARECVYAKIRDIDSDVERTARLLTRHGMYRVLASSTTPVGDLVREFIYMVLDKLDEDGVVHLANVQSDMQLYYNEEIKKATDYLSQRVQSLETEILASGRILRRNTELMHKKEKENCQLSHDKQILKCKINTLEERLLLAELDINNNDNDDLSLLEYLKSRYMKHKVNVYLLPSKDETDYDYDFKSYDIMNPPEESDMMYYRITRNECKVPSCF